MYIEKQGAETTHPSALVPSLSRVRELVSIPDEDGKRRLYVIKEQSRLTTLYTLWVLPSPEPLL